MQPKLRLYMTYVLIPLGLLLFIGFFAFAIIHTVRKQREAKAKVYRDFAESHWFHYREQDDGRAQEFAGDFDGIGRFRSPSLGEVIPRDVVEGTIDGVETIVFRHSIRFSEDFAREWFVAGVTCHFRSSWLRQAVPGELPQPKVEFRGLPIKMRGDFLSRFGKHILDNVRRVKPGAQSRVDAHRDHSSELVAVPAEQLFDGGTVPQNGSLHQRTRLNGCTIS